jgi:hypothetical protein
MDEEFEIPKIRPRTGFILSVIAALLIILSSVAMLYVSFNPSLLELEEVPSSLEDAAETLNMTTEDMMASMSLGMGVFGIVSGILVIFGGALAYYRDLRTAGGILVILFSILSLFGGAGLFIGLILGVIGGVLILMNR